MFDHETTAADVLTDAALGAIAGVAATAAMGPLTSYLSKHQPEPAKRREKEVNEKLGAPPTVKVAQKAVATLGKSLPAHRHSLAGNVVHYGFGTFWGAALGALSARWRAAPPRGRGRPGHPPVDEHGRGGAPGTGTERKARRVPSPDPCPWPGRTRPLRGGPGPGSCPPPGRPGPLARLPRRPTLQVRGRCVLCGRPPGEG